MKKAKRTKRSKLAEQINVSAEHPNGKTARNGRKSSGKSLTSKAAKRLDCDRLATICRARFWARHHAHIENARGWPGAGRNVHRDLSTIHRRHSMPVPVMPTVTVDRWTNCWKVQRRGRNPSDCWKVMNCCRCCQSSVDQRRCRQSPRRACGCRPRSR